MIKKVLKRDNGVTLVELIVAMTIFLVVITIAVGGFVSLVRLQGQTEAMTDVQQNGRIVMEQLTRLSRQSSAVNINTGVGEIDQIVFKDRDSNYICITVDISEIDAQGKNTMKIKKYINDNCTGGGLTLTSSDVKVTKFQFSKAGGIPSILDISIVVKSKDPLIGKNSAGEDTLTLESSVVLTGVK